MVNKTSGLPQNTVQMHARTVTKVLARSVNKEWRKVVLFKESWGVDCRPPYPARFAMQSPTWTD